MKNPKSQSHQPRVLLLHGTKGRWNAKDRVEQATYENSCEAWAFAFEADYIQHTKAKTSDLLGYDIIIANSDNWALAELRKLSDARPPSAKWVTILEGDSLDFIKPRANIRELLDNSDLVNCINKYAVEYIRCLTIAPVEYLGFPYPAEGIRAYSTPLAKRRKEIFLAPLLLSRWSEYFCVKNLGIPLYGYEKRLSRRLNVMHKHLFDHGTLNPMHLHKKTNQLYRDPELKIDRTVNLTNFFRRSGESMAWIALDPRYTWGRYVLDAAALQVPIISTRSTGHAETFFPDLMVENEFEIEKAASLMKRLFTDKEFYDHVSLIPIERFEHLSAKVLVAKLLAALGY